MALIAASLSTALLGVVAVIAMVAGIAMRAVDWLTGKRKTWGEERKP